MPSKRREPPNPKNLLSLFTGAMGLDLGLELSGFKPRVTLEINKAATETIKLNRPKLPVVTKSIVDISGKELLQEAALRKKEVTLISAGPCCQSFSTAGNRQSVSDDRGSLFQDFCRIVKEIRPRFFVMENVKGILSAAVKHRPLEKRGAGFPPLSSDEVLGSGLKLILNQFAKLDYYVIFGLLNAADYGVPQTRWRVFFIGSRDGEDIELPPPTHHDPKESADKNGLADWVTLRKALKGVRPKNWNTFADDRIELLRRVNPGQDWRNLPKRLHRKALGNAFYTWGGRTGFCRRLAWDKPSPTLTTEPTGRATTLCHPSEDRPLSVEEYATLQQFPTDWKFAGSINQQYMQIGNAVPLGLGAAVGRMLRRTMKKTSRARPTRKNYERRGLVVCADPNLQSRLANRKKTILSPPEFRKSKDLQAARDWLASSGNRNGKR